MIKSPESTSNTPASRAANKDVRVPVKMSRPPQSVAAKTDGPKSAENDGSRKEGEKEDAAVANME